MFLFPVGGWHKKFEDCEGGGGGGGRELKIFRTGGFTDLFWGGGGYISWGDISTPLHVMQQGLLLTMRSVQCNDSKNCIGKSFLIITEFHSCYYGIDKYHSL